MLIRGFNKSLMGFSTPRQLRLRVFAQWEYLGLALFEDYAANLAVNIVQRQWAVVRRID